MVPFSLMENQCYCHSINVVNCEKPLSNSLLWTGMDKHMLMHTNTHAWVVQFIFLIFFRA